MCPEYSVITGGLEWRGGRGHQTQASAMITEYFWVYVSGMFRDHGGGRGGGGGG